jgi:hypothetical protein
VTPRTHSENQPTSSPATIIIEEPRGNYSSTGVRTLICTERLPITQLSGRWDPASRGLLSVAVSPARVPRARSKSAPSGVRTRTLGQSSVGIAMGSCLLRTLGLVLRFNFTL